jgi:uncharacterized protein YgbK (DUF1537 family)
MTRPLYAYYGDDFTGSTDVLEVLASAGVDSVLFVDAPSEALERKFATCRAFGIAGDSRSRSPQWMSTYLPALLTRLGALGAPITQYKTCSTFDSAPEVGSIGRALEIGHATLPGPFIPIVVGAPHLGRYVVFGNLFAAAAGSVYRIDRHPTMRSHPVTPMHEADLCRHLASQTAMRVGRVELPALAEDAAAEALNRCVLAGDQAVLFDGVSEMDLLRIGTLIWDRAGMHRLFCAGSSGLPYALIGAWRRAGLIAAEPLPRRTARTVDRLLVVSGSCSPITERQIQTALRTGYRGVAVDAEALVSDGRGAASADRLVEEVLRNLRDGHSTVVYSALGALKPGTAAAGAALGQCLGRLTARILAAAPLPRVLLAGGDTSSHAVAQMGLQALTWHNSLEPGAPLCLAHADGAALDGLELVLKGGQVGSDGFFDRVRLGR